MKQYLIYNNLIFYFEELLDQKTKRNFTCYVLKSLHNQTYEINKLGKPQSGKKIK